MKIIGQFFEPFQETGGEERDAGSVSSHGHKGFARSGDGEQRLGDGLVVVPSCQRAVIAAARNRLVVCVNDDGLVSTFDTDTGKLVSAPIDVHGRVIAIEHVPQHDAIAVLVQRNETTTVVLVHAWYDVQRAKPTTLDVLDVKCISVCPILGNLAVARGRDISLFSFQAIDAGILPCLLAVVSTPLNVGRVALCEQYLAYASPSQVEVISIDLERVTKRHEPPAEHTPPSSPRAACAPAPSPLRWRRREWWEPGPGERAWGTESQPESGRHTPRGGQHADREDEAATRRAGWQEDGMHTEQGVTVSLNAKQLRHMKPQLVEFPALEYAHGNKQKTQGVEIRPTDNTPLISVRTLHVGVACQVDGHECTCVTLHLRFTTDQLDTLALKPCFLLDNDVVLAPQEWDVRAALNEPLRACRENNTLTQGIRGAHLLHTGAHKGHLYRVDRHHSALISEYSFALPESAQTCCFNSTRVFATTTGDTPRLYTFTLRLQETHGEEEHLLGPTDPSSSVLWIGSTYLEGRRVLRACVSEDVFGIVSVHDDPATNDSMSIGGSSNSAPPPPQGGTGPALEVSVYKPRCTVDLCDHLKDFAFTLPSGHPNVMLALRECNLLLSTEVFMLAVAGAARASSHLHSKYTRALGGLRASFAVLADAMMGEGSPNWTEVANHLLLSERTVEKCVACLSHHLLSSSDAAMLQSQLMLTLFHTGAFCQRCEDEAKGFELLANALAHLEQQPWTDAVQVVLSSSALCRRLRSSQRLLDRLSGSSNGSTSRDSPVEQQLLLCVLQAPDGSEGSQPLSGDGISYWRAALGKLDTDALTAFISKLKEEPDLVVGCDDDSARWSPRPLFFACAAYSVDVLVAVLHTALDALQASAAELIRLVSDHIADEELRLSITLHFTQALVTKRLNSLCEEDRASAITAFVLSKSTALTAQASQGLPTFSHDTSARFSWLDHLPPYAPGYVPGVGGSAATLSDLKHLQAFCCEHISAAFADSLCAKIDERAEFPGKLSLELICLASSKRVDRGAELVLQCHPRLLPDYLATCAHNTTQVMMSLIGQLQQCIEGSEKTAPHTEGGRRAPPQQDFFDAYTGLLRRLSASLDLEELLVLLPSSMRLDFALPFLYRSCQRSAANELVAMVVDEATQDTEGRA